MEGRLEELDTGQALPSLTPPPCCAAQQLCLRESQGFFLLGPVQRKLSYQHSQAIPLLSCSLVSSPQYCAREYLRLFPTKSVSFSYSKEEATLVMWLVLGFAWLPLAFLILKSTLRKIGLILLLAVPAITARY